MAKKNGAALSFESMVSSNTVSAKDAKKKATIPVIKLDTEHSAKLREFLEAKQKMKEHETAMRSAEAPIQNLCLNRQDEDGLSGQFASSYELVTDDGKNSVKFISVDKFYLSQDPDNITTLQDLLGENFDKEVKQETTVTLKQEVFEDEKLKKELVALVGAQFSKFFQTVVAYKMKPGFDERLYKLAKNTSDARQYRTICGKVKASLK